jgi:hypothetical protein
LYRTGESWATALLTIVYQQNREGL